MVSLRKKARDGFFELLKEKPNTITFATVLDSSQTEEIKQLFADDVRYHAWDSDDKERNRMLKEYVEELKKEQAKKAQAKPKAPVEKDEQ
jgi:hypothetical protein